MKLYNSILPLLCPLAIFGLLSLYTCRPASAEFSRQDKVVVPFSNIDAQQVEDVLQAMTLEEKIGQLLIWKPDAHIASSTSLLADKVAGGKVGGFLINGLEVGQYVYLSDSLKRTAFLPLLFGTDEKVMLHGQFAGLPEMPLPATVGAIDSAGLQLLLEKHYLDQCRTLGINFSFKPTFFHKTEDSSTFDFNIFDHDETAAYERAVRNIRQLTTERMLTFANGLSELVLDPSASRDGMRLEKYLQQTRSGLTGLALPEELFIGDATGEQFIGHFFDAYLDFNGLSLARLKADESPVRKLEMGVHLLITPDIDFAHQEIYEMVMEGRWPEENIDRVVRRILKAKSWISGGRLPVDLSVMPRDSNRMPVTLVSFDNKRKPALVRRPVLRPVGLDAKVADVRCYFEEPVWEMFSNQLFEQSVILAKDTNAILPFQDLMTRAFRLYEFEGTNFRTFEEYFSKYADFDLHRMPLLPNGGLPALDADPEPADGLVSIILLDRVDLQPDRDSSFINSLNTLSHRSDIVLINFGNPLNLRFFDNSLTFLQVMEHNQPSQMHVAQSMFGGVGVGGKMPVRINNQIPYGSSRKLYPIRIGFANSETAGIANERLVGINAIAETAIDNHVFPGCQIVVAKSGKVIYDQAFGYHTYARTTPVRTDDLYDIASLTKVAATTLGIMRLTEQQKLSIQGKVGNYAELSTSSSVNNIRIRDLLAHSSGLQAPMPIGKFFNYRNVPSRGCNDIFCKKPTENYTTRIANNLFFRSDYQDTIWKRVMSLPVGSRRYRYSDVNFYLLQKVIEDQSGEKLDQFISSNFYNPLGLRHITYNPLIHFPPHRIVPTERDRRWRKSLVHGYVHDPSAALMGGVGGNAGLFSNAEDLAVLFQMLLNEGSYGGRRYLEPGTVKDFTAAKYGNHRGLGFDKPSDRRYTAFSRKASRSTFGHTGFTGTCVWVDPEYDLVYVFLSNRIHPSVNNKKLFTENIRSRIHDVVYRSFDTFDPALPELPAADE